MYFMCQLARDLGITLDQMNEVTSHGKDEADGHGGVIKTWLTNEMRRVELDKGEAPAMQLADMVNGVEASFAATAAARGGAEMGDLKVAHMNKLRREKSNTVSREFRTYTEADIADLKEEIKSMTAALSRDVPASIDSRMKATLAHNNYRADPELQTREKRIICVRRIACGCAGCMARLRLPLPQRYEPHDTCERFRIFGRMNDWKLVELVLTEEGDEAREEIEQLGLQERTDEIASLIGEGEAIAIAAPGDKRGFYIADTTGTVRQLDAPLTVHALKDEDGQPLQLAAGSSVIDARFRNPVERVRGCSKWYTDFLPDDPEGDVVVPTHLILRAGFVMAPAEAARAPWSKVRGEEGFGQRWGNKHAMWDAVCKGARVLSDGDATSIQDEIDRRR